MADCPYCGKELVENERYCHHCEQDTEDKESYKNKPAKPLKNRIKEVSKPIIDSIKKIYSKIKKK